MKKLLPLLVASALIATISSCGSAPKAENSSPKTPDTISPDSIIMDLPASPMLLLDNFEDGNFWYGVGDTWDQWGSHNLSLTADLSTEWGTDGENSLLCKMDPALENTSKQATWCCDSLIETDLSAYNYCAVDVYVPGEEKFNLSIAIQNGTDWAWDQTESILVGKGKHTLVFDMSNFSDEHLENVFRFMIQQAEYVTEGTVIYFDNFRVYE